MCGIGAGLQICNLVNKIMGSFDPAWSYQIIFLKNFTVKNETILRPRTDCSGHPKRCVWFEGMETVRLLVSFVHYFSTLFTDLSGWVEPFFVLWVVHCGGWGWWFVFGSSGEWSSFLIFDLYVPVECGFPLRYVGGFEWRLSCCFIKVVLCFRCWVYRLSSLIFLKKNIIAS